MWKLCLIAVVAAVSLSAGAGRTGSQPARATTVEVNAYVTAYLREQLSRVTDRAARYSLASTDLNGDGVEQALVHVTGSFCGTAGCGLIVFTRQGRSWRVLSEGFTGHAPFHLLATTSHGWRDIGVFVAGGGATPHEARLVFTATGYPENPYEAPASAPAEPGRVLIGRDSPSSPIFPWPDRPQ